MSFYIAGGEAAWDSSEGPVDFYGGPFSNFAPCVFGAEDEWGRTCMYRSVEHFFQAWKATTPEDHDYVRTGSGPQDAKDRGRKIKLRSDWEEIKYNIMVFGLRAKFMMPEYKRRLLETGNREIREDSPSDFIWGYRNNGQNLLGKALMQVRAEIKEAEVT